MLEAVKVALDPTPRQERLLESHAGAARFAYNNGLAHVKDMLERGDTPEWSYYALRRWWNQAKNTLAVFCQIFVGRFGVSFSPFERLFLGRFGFGQSCGLSVIA